MKRIVISGYYGYDNIGDEALLKAIVEALRSFDAQLHITVLSAQPEKTSKSLGVDSVSRTNLREIIQAIKKCDLFISGGGSLLQDVTGPLTIPYYLGIVMIAKALKKPVMFYAQGIGPVTKNFGRTLIKQIVSRVELITLRDRESAQLLEDIGVRGPRIKVTADPVFAIPKGEKGSQEEVLREFGIEPENGPVVGVALRSWTNNGKTLEAVAKAIDHLQGKGRQVVLIPMHYQQDLPAAIELQKGLQNPAILLNKNYGPEKLLRLIGSLEMIIAMRLHALIFGAVKRVPPIGISYDPKVEQFLKTPGCFMAGTVETVKAEVLIGQIEYVINNRAEVFRQLEDHCGKLREKALENARLATELMAGDGCYREG